MFMRITWAKVRPGGWAQYEARFKELSQTAPGLQARWMVRDTSDPDASYAVGLWDSVEAMHAWEQSDYFKEVLEPGMRPFLVGAYSVSVCEVRDCLGER